LFTPLRPEKPERRRQACSEYDFVDSRLLDLRATYKFADWLSIRVGQWKSEFNRERIDSSGKQQFVERSIVTPWFTIDRQQAVLASGLLGKPSDLVMPWMFGLLGLVLLADSAAYLISGEGLIQF